MLRSPQGLFLDHAVRSDTEIQYRRPNGAAATTEKGLSYVSQHGVEMTDVMSPCLLSKLHVRGISCSVWLLIEPRIPLLIGSQCRRSRRRGGGGGEGGTLGGGGGGTRGLSVFGAGFVCQPKIAHCGICLRWINGDCHVVIALAFFRLALNNNHTYSLRLFSRERERT